MIFSDWQMWLRSPARRWLSADVQPDLVLICRYATLLAPSGSQEMLLCVRPSVHLQALSYLSEHTYYLIRQTESKTLRLAGPFSQLMFYQECCQYFLSAGMAGFPLTPLCWPPAPPSSPRCSRLPPAFTARAALGLGPSSCQVQEFSLDKETRLNHKVFQSKWTYSLMEFTVQLQHTSYLLQSNTQFIFSLKS